MRTAPPVTTSHPARGFLILLRMFVLNILALLFAAPASSNNLKFYAEASSFAYSEASAVYQIYKNRWQDQPDPNGHIALQRNRLRIGVREDWLSLEFIDRQDWYFQFSPDTARFIRLQQLKQPIPADQQYNLLLKVNHLAAQGARFGFHTPEWQGISLSGYFSLLAGKAIQQGSINGSVQQASHGQLQASGTIEYRYHQDQLLEHAIPAPYGQGAAVDLQLRWQHPRAYAEVTLEDLWMQMDWQNAPFTRGTLQTNNTSHTDEGFIIHNPAFSGRRGANNLQQNTLPVWMEAKAGLKHQQWLAGGGMRRYAALSFPSIHLGWHNSEQRHHYTLHYETTNHLLSLHYQWQTPGTHLQGWFGSDNTNLRFAKTLEAGLALSFIF